MELSVLVRPDTASDPRSLNRHRAGRESIDINFQNERVAFLMTLISSVWKNCFCPYGHSVACTLYSAQRGLLLY
jgi:hypothetical protein